MLKRLMVAAQGGDRAAYDELLRTCLPIIRRMARHHGAPDDLIDDVMQESLLTIHRARHTYDPERSFIAWMSMITHRRVVDALRQRMRRSTREIYAPVAYEAFAMEEPTELSAEGDFVPVRHAIEGLPEAQREAVERLALKEQSLQEAALQTGRTAVALKVNLHRALKTLRNRVARRDRDD